ncbi:hypothetical protein AGLY_005934 [Aphis glycines]|uniref:Uncharacterized protein n=1 Tax=Aphis glycines TaxID=307491 RepID=A0A6G0TUM0_APHGL|nr:hypothetical protein AGLY_005934 [Aphis glycines]
MHSSIPIENFHDLVAGSYQFISHISDKIIKTKSYFISRQSRCSTNCLWNNNNLLSLEQGIFIKYIHLGLFLRRGSSTTSFIYALELDTNSIQLCKSANALIPRQFEGFSCFCKNLTHASLTNSNCKKLEAVESRCFILTTSLLLSLKQVNIARKYGLADTKTTLCAYSTVPSSAFNFISHKTSFLKQTSGTNRYSTKLFLQQNAKSVSAR